MCGLLVLLVQRGLNSLQSSCLGLLRIGITGVHRQAQLWLVKSIPVSRPMCVLLTLPVMLLQAVYVPESTH